MIGTLAVVAVAGTEAAAASAELGVRGAQDIEARVVGGDRALVTGRFEDAEAAREAVAGLRRQGWAASQRPVDDDPAVIAWRHRTEPILVGDGRLLVALP